MGLSSETSTALKSVTRCVDGLVGLLAVAGIGWFGAQRLFAAA